MVTVSEQAMARFLRRLLLRSALSETERSEILALPGQAVQIAARRDVVLPGETVSHACLVAEGLLARFDQMRDGSRAITALHIPGDMADLHSFVSPTAGWGITALEPTTIVQVPHAAIGELAERCPAVVMAFWRDATADAAILAKWTAIIGRKAALVRVAHLLCEMGGRMEAAGLGSCERYDLPLTQEQLGETMGLTSVHINRTLRVLREHRVATFNSRRVEISDLARLIDIADYNNRFLLFDRPPSRQFG